MMTSTSAHSPWSGLTCYWTLNVNINILFIVCTRNNIPANHYNNDNLRNLGPQPLPKNFKWFHFLRKFFWISLVMVYYIVMVYNIWFTEGCRLCPHELPVPVLRSSCPQQHLHLLVRPVFPQERGSMELLCQ